MAGLPWIIVFLLIAWLAMRRGWTWIALIAVFCLGGMAIGTDLGSTIIGGAQTMLATVWAGIVSLANSAAG